MAATVERERTFAFRMERAMVSTIGIPEDPIVIDAVVSKKTMPNLNPRAVLLSIKTEERKFALAMYFKGSNDKEGYRELIPHYHDAEDFYLYDADVFLSYPFNSRKIVRDARTALNIISRITDFDFENAEYGFGLAPDVINLHAHGGIKVPEGEPAYRVSIALKKVVNAPVVEKRE